MHRLWYLIVPKKIKLILMIHLLETEQRYVVAANHWKETKWMVKALPVTYLPSTQRASVTCTVISTHFMLVLRSRSFALHLWNSLTCYLLPRDPAEWSSLWLGERCLRCSADFFQRAQRVSAQPRHTWARASPDIFNSVLFSSVHIAEVWHLCRLLLA